MFIEVGRYADLRSLEIKTVGASLLAIAVCQSP
jgi:hypothetical protein